MEAVRAFNNELSGLYEAKPPVSRAKMALLTKCAIKAIKFYKHVVQSVEKFIQKCKPEYKVPGLYVIDSIVRQSRHQFGAEKDVFAPRFTKNVVLTFQNLFKCPPDEKSKVVRVLNLWQKNAVFPVEVIQPLLDLAAEPGNPELVASAQRAVDGILAANQKTGNSTNQQSGEHHSHDSAAAARHDKDIPSANSVLEAQNDMLETVKQLLQQTQKQPTSLSAQQQQLQQLQLLQQQLLQQTELMQQPAQQQQAAAIIDSNLLSQIQTLTNQLLNNQIKTSNSKPPEPGFNKKLLDFDYGESDDDDDNKHEETNEVIPGNVQNILNDPTIMQQIHQMSQTIKKTEQLKNELNIQEQLRQQLLKQQEQEFNQQISQDAAPPTPHHLPVPPQMPPQPPPTQMIQPQAPNMHPPPMPYYVPEPQYPPPPSQNDLPDRMDLDGRHDRHYNQMGNADVIVIDDQPEIHKPSRNRDRSRSRSPRRKKRSRSRSRSKERRRRSRSRDRERERGGDRDRDRDRRKRSRSRERERERQREKERERRRKGLPNIKERNLSVCTRTIWLGHVAKVTTEDELRLEIEKYGAVETINMIPPRGCAFVCMARRKDAAKAVEKLKGVKIHSNQLKVAWAPGIGVKDAEYKDLWDVELGVTYIPWEKLPQDLTHLMEGGMIDEETVPDHLKAGLNLDKPDTVETNNLEEPAVNFKMNEVNMPSAPIAIPPPAAIPPSQPPMQGQPMPRMLMQIPPPAGMMPPLMMPIAPGMPRPPTTGVPPPPLGMAPSSTSQAQVLPPRPVPPVQTAMTVPSMAQTVVLTSVAPSTISNPSMPSLPPPAAVQLSQGIQNTLSNAVTGGITVPPRPPPAFTAQLRQQPRPFPPPFQPGATFRMQMHETVRGMAAARPPLDPNIALQSVDKEKLSESNKEEWLKRTSDGQNEEQDSEMQLEVGSQEPDTTPDTMLHASAMPPMSAAALQQMLAQRPPPSPAMGLRPHLPPGMGPRPGMNGPPTELRLAGPNGPLLTGPPNRQATIGIPGMPANISIGPRALSVEGPPPGFTAARMGLPGGPRFAPRGFPPVFPGGPPPRFQGPMGAMLRPPRPDAEGRFPAGTFSKNGTFERGNFERTPRPFGPGGPRNERPGGERWMGRDRWGPRDNGPGMRFRREFDQREEFFDRSRYVLDNRDPGGAGGRRGNRFEGDEENSSHHYDDDRERSRHEEERDRPRRDDDREWSRRDDDRDRSRRGDERDRSRRDERDRSRHDDERERSRHDDDRERSRHDDDRNRNRHDDRDRFRHGEAGREGPESGRSRNREDRPRKSRWSDAEDKSVETPMEVSQMNPAKPLETVPEGVEPPTVSDQNVSSEPMKQCPADVAPPPPPDEMMTSTQDVPPTEEMAADTFEKPKSFSSQEKYFAPGTNVTEDFTPAEDFSAAPAKEFPPADNNTPTKDFGPTENVTPEQTYTPAEEFAPPVKEDFTPAKECEPAPTEFTPSENIAPSEEKPTEFNSPSEQVAPVQDITHVVDTLKEVQEPCEPPVQNNDNNNDDNNEDVNEKTEIETE